VSKIIRLEIENFKKLKAIEIHVDGSGAIIISGPNEAGKTSVLDAIAVAVAGKKFAKDLVKPIRDGKEKASVTVETDDGLIITRKWSKNDSPGTLTLTDKNGGKYSSPQEFLNNMIGDLSFDPLGFANSKPVDQRKSLLGLVNLGIDLDHLESEKTRMFDLRTSVNRDAKAKKNQLDGMEIPKDDIPEEKSVKELTDKYQKAIELTSSQKDHMRSKEIYEQRISEKRIDLKKLEDSIKETESLLEKVNAEIKEHEAVDIDAIKSEIANVEKTNEQIRIQKSNAETYEKTRKEKEEYEDQSRILTENLDEIEQTKQKALSAARFPIKGLGFDESGITFKGIPFQQCSLSERLKVSIAIAMKMNPKFQVLRVTDASLLDPANMKIIDVMAKKMDFQVWLEVVSSGNGEGICIEEGQVVKQSQKKEAEII